MCLGCILGGWEVTCRDTEQCMEGSLCCKAQQLAGFFFWGPQRGNTFTSKTSSARDHKFLLTHLPRCITGATSPADQFPMMQIWRDTSLGNLYISGLVLRFHSSESPDGISDPWQTPRVSSAPASCSRHCPVLLTGTLPPIFWSSAGFSGLPWRWRPV